ncbi:MAG TPA: serine hydrolase [Verrucomicrobiales bacterium]|nr:serine hydrolase [Verrucomicrobiales bacterium]
MRMSAGFAARLCALPLFFGIPGRAAAAGWPDGNWPTADPAGLEIDESQLHAARDYALTGGGSGCIIFEGTQILSWGDQAALYDLKSSSKAIGVTALGLALKDGKVKLDDPAVKFHPAFGVPPDANAQTGWLEKITLRHLAAQTAGFEKPGGYTDLLFVPGTKWHYSNGGPNWLAECLTLTYGRDLNEVLFERVFTPIGIAAKDLSWRKNAYRPDLINGIKRREFGSGFSANVQAMSRIGYLYLRDGWWKGEQILTHNFIEAVRQPSPAFADLPAHDKTHGEAAAHYGLLWWNNADGTLADVPRDAYWSWGLYDSLIVVMPNLDLVIARAGKSWDRAANAAHYDPLKPFLGPISRAVAGARKKAAAPPASPSPVIKRIVWAPANTIIRKAAGSDNWPMTWADDNALYAAYGDGNGFEPFLPEKLSTGFAKITGEPLNPGGINIRSPSGEAKGDGRNGRKCSGMLMVDGVLYQLARNTGNARLGWSADHAATWTWADWKFTAGFGCPGFLNFGKNYSGARDDYVYLYSHDADNAYDRADRMVMARVPRTRLREQNAFEFFVRTDADGVPVWSRDITQRGAVFSNPGKCYRSSMSYDAGLKRYLWCMTGPGADTRFSGGFTLYDAPEPWGPWTVAFHSDAWDTGPGEMMHLPTKWMSADGRTVHLVFSGNDAFSVRQGTIELHGDK